MEHLRTGKNRAMGDKCSFCDKGDNSAMGNKYSICEQETIEQWETNGTFVNRRQKFNRRPMELCEQVNTEQWETNGTFVNRRQ
jgi:methionyl-tRNA synthetase